MTEESLSRRLEEREERQLVANAQSDLREFSALYQRFLQPVYRYLYSRVGSQAEAEEITSQTFLSALEGFTRFRNDGHFAAWLFTIARRKSIDYFRRTGKLISLSEGFPSADEDLLQQAIHTSQKDWLRAQLAGLTEEERELLRLRFAANLGFSEIGRILGRSEGAVKKNLYRLLVRLQKEMELSHE